MPNVQGNYRYIMTCVDSFTRFFVAFPLRNCGAKDATKCLISLINQHRVIPKVISSDRGTHFTGEVFRQACMALGINQRLHVAWRPQSSGLVERQHRTMKSAI